MEISENRKSLRKVAALRMILLVFWMSAILALQILLYPPPPILKVAEELGILNPVVALQNKIRPFFETTDINMDFVIKF